MGKKYISESFVKVGGTTTEYLMADGSTSIVVSDGIPSSPLQVTSTGIVVSGTATFIPLSTWFQNRQIYPYINKQYPEFTDLVNAYDNIPAILPSITGNLVESITFNNIDGITSASNRSYTNVQKLFFPTLKYIMSTFTTTITNGYFNEFQFPVLKGIFGNFTIPLSTTLTSINFPLLEVATFTNANTSLQSILLPEILQLSLVDNIANPIVQYSFPKVRYITNFILGASKSSLTTINLPSIEVVQSTMTFPTSSTLLSTINLGTSLKAFNSNFVTTSNSLTQTSVDNILIQLSLLDGTNGTIIYQNRTITLTGSASTPSSAGLSAKAILVSRGCTITHN